MEAAKGVLGDPAGWAAILKAEGFLKGVGFLLIFTGCLIVLALVVRGPKWLSVVLEHRREMKKIENERVERRFKLLRQLHEAIERRRLSRLDDDR